MDSNVIHNGNALDVLKTFPDNSIDGMVTDPPYGYQFMNKEWDKAVISVETWKECLRVLKPGSFACIMSSPRQDVLCKMTLNLIDTGFRTDFTSIYWTYASGFPKAANVSKLVDKRAGAERKIQEISENSRPNSDRGNGLCHGEYGKEWNITEPATEQAKTLDGSYAGYQPKPAVEVILMVMKPLSEKTFVDQALSNGKGVTWLDSVKIPSSDSDETKRFPANLLVSDDVLNDGRVRVSKYGKQKQYSSDSESHMAFCNKEQKTINGVNSFVGDSGSYSRYFDLDRWFETIFPFIITPKASKSERNMGLDKWIEPQKVNDGRQTPIDNPFQRGETLRNNTHPTVKPIKLMSYLIHIISRPNDIILDPFLGSGTTAMACKMSGRKYVGIELNKEYADIAKQRLKSLDKTNNNLKIYEEW